VLSVSSNPFLFGAIIRACSVLSNLQCREREDLSTVQAVLSPTAINDSLCNSLLAEKQDAARLSSHNL